jgi:hypothetical protein
MDEVNLIMLLAIIIATVWYIRRAVRLDARTRQSMMEENPQAFLSYQQEKARAYRRLCLGGACGFAVSLAMGPLISPYLWAALTRPETLYWGIGDSIIMGWLISGVFGGVVGAILGLLTVGKNKHE